jgi:hypothetical protein
MIVMVGRFPTIPLEMSIGIVYGSPTDSPASGIAWKTCIGRGGTWIDPTISLRNVVIHGLSAGARMSCWLVLYPRRVGY